MYTYVCMHIQVVLPMNNPTSCAIGGTKMDTLYITTARHRLTEEERAKVSALKLLVYEPLSYSCMRPEATNLPVRP